ncbi:MAG: ABC transporter ATP-binding protein [Eubacteriaceae bacterium]|nr:ABC transporter ATP-binding protein [Eubacteriaceae bacterium]
MSLLEVKNCTIRYQNGTSAVSNVSFSVEKGEIVSLVGESGSGKTTMIRAILGLLPPGGRVTEGEIILDGRNLLSLSEREQEELRGKDIAMIFQDVGASMDPIKLIKSQYIEAIKAHERISTEESYNKATDMLRRMHLTDANRVMASYPFELSGGMKQRVGISIGMTAQPKLLLADEPTSALDVTIQAQVVHELKELRDKYGATIILVTHNMGVASYLSDKIGVMKTSQMVEFGTRDDIILNPKERYTKDLIDAVPKMGGKRFAR